MRPSARCALRICRTCRSSAQHGSAHSRPLRLARAYSWRRGNKTLEEIAATESTESLMEALGLAPQKKSEQSDSTSSQADKGWAEQASPSRQPATWLDRSKQAAPKSTSDAPSRSMNDRSRKSARGKAKSKRGSPSDHIASSDEVEALIRGFGDGPTDRPSRSNNRSTPARRASTSDHIASADQVEALICNPGPVGSQESKRKSEAGNTSKNTRQHQKSGGMNKAYRQPMNSREADALIRQLRESMGLRTDYTNHSQPSTDDSTQPEKVTPSNAAPPETITETESLQEPEFDDDSTLDDNILLRKDDESLPEDNNDVGDDLGKQAIRDLHSEDQVDALPNAQVHEAADMAAEPTSHTSIEELEGLDVVSIETIAEGKVRPRRKYGDELLYQKEVGVKALGKDFDALILRNPNKMASSMVDVPIVERDQPSIPFDLKSVVEATQHSEVADSQADLFRTIEELRTGEATVLRQSQFDEVQSALLEGFTTDQLRDYYRNQPKAEPESPGSYSWITRHYGLPQTTAPSVRLGSKPGFAQRIMRDIWCLETHEEHEKLIEAAFAIQIDAWWLLDNPASELSKTIRQDLLDASNQETMNLRKEAKGEPLLILRTRKATIPAVLSRIDAAVTSITSRKVELSTDASRSLFANWLGLDHVRLALGRPTQTFIGLEGPAASHQDKDQAPQQLAISWLPTEDRPAADCDINNAGGSRLEDPADVVTRLVLRKPEAALFAKEATKRSKSAPPYERTLKGLSAFDRSGWEWSRLASNGRDTNSTIKSGDQILDLPVLKSVVRKSTSKLGLDTTETLNATFGHILWRHQGKVQAQTRANRGDSRSTKQPRAKKAQGQLGIPQQIILPVVPHPAALTSITTPSAANAEDVKKQTTIVLHFEPHPLLSSPDDLNANPDVRLQMPVASDADLSNFQIPTTTTLNMVSRAAQGVMFPGSSVDARVQHEQLSPLDNQNVSEFLQASEFNLADGRIRTPSVVHLEMSRAGKTIEGGDDVMSRVPYLFTGLEVHQSIEMPWEGVTLRYTSVEAGLHGGQRQELSLVRDVPNDMSKAKRKSELASLMKLVREVAEGQHFSWTRGATDMKPTTRPARDTVEDWPSVQSSGSHSEIVSNPFAVQELGDTVENSLQDVENELPEGAAAVVDTGHQGSDTATSLFPLEADGEAATIDLATATESSVSSPIMNEGETTLSTSEDQADEPSATEQHDFEAIESEGREAQKVEGNDGHQKDSPEIDGSEDTRGTASQTERQDSSP